MVAPDLSHRMVVVLRRTLLSLLGLSVLAPAETAAAPSPAGRSLFERDAEHWMADPDRVYPSTEGRSWGLHTWDTTQAVSYSTYQEPPEVESLIRVVRQNTPDRLAMVSSIWPEPGNPKCWKVSACLPRYTTTG